MSFASVVVLTKNAGNEFGNNLALIMQQRHVDFEVIIIDSGSTDETLDVIKEYPSIRLFCIRPEEFHHSKTRNYAASLAKGDCIVFITQDACPVGNEWLSNLVKPFTREEVAAVYGKQIPYEDVNLTEKFFYAYFYPDDELCISGIGESLENMYVYNVYFSDVNSAMRKEVWEKYKFNENIIMAEDKDWAFKVLAAGYELIYAPQSTVFHSHKYSLISAFQRRFDDGVAMRQICGHSRSPGTLGRGLSYVMQELRYIGVHRPALIPYAVLYNLFKFGAILLGNNERYLPLSVKKRISKHSSWWAIK